MGKREGSRKLRPDGMDDFGFLYCEKEYPWEAKNGVLRLQYMCVPLVRSTLGANVILFDAFSY